MALKHWVYFGLGSLATACFGLRTLSQWLLSEKKQQSHITPLFWVLSIAGNVLMFTHYLVQVQFHFYLIRIFPLYFSFRQFSLMRQKASPFSWSRLLKIMVLLTSCSALIFLLRTYLEFQTPIWILNPKMPWQLAASQTSISWHLFGLFGAGLFTSRLWVQWWQSEKAKESIVTPLFWWLSLTGALITLTYALSIGDLITALGYTTGLIPYIRNLMLSRKKTDKEPAI